MGEFAHGVPTGKYLEQMHARSQESKALAVRVERLEAVVAALIEDRDARERAQKDRERFNW